MPMGRYMPTVLVASKLQRSVHSHSEKKLKMKSSLIKK